MKTVNRTAKERITMFYNVLKTLDYAPTYEQLQHLVFTHVPTVKYPPFEIGGPPTITPPSATTLVLFIAHKEFSKMDGDFSIKARNELADRVYNRASQAATAFDLLPTDYKELEALNDLEIVRGELVEKKK